MTNDGRAATFGRNLIQYIQNRLPYSTDGRGENDALNPKYKFFQKAGMRRAEALAKASVSSSNPYNNIPIGDFAKDSSFGDVMYANIQDDKQGRLRDYRIMAAYSEVADALDEICDECVNKDEQGDIAKLNIHKDKLNPNIQRELREEFQRFVTLYDLEDKGWEYFRTLLVDGEIYFEHVIHEKRKDAGILGILQIPGELVDPIYDNVQNLMIKAFLLRKPVIDKFIGNP